MPNANTIYNRLDDVHPMRTSPEKDYSGAQGAAATTRTRRITTSLRIIMLVGDAEYLGRLFDALRGTAEFFIFSRSSLFFL